MINQCCTEIFTTSKKTYQVIASALLSKKLPITHTLKARDKNQQHPDWMMAKQPAVRNISGVLNELARWRRLNMNFHSVFFFFFIYSCHCGFQTQFQMDCLIMWNEKLSCLSKWETWYLMESEISLCLSHFRICHFIDSHETLTLTGNE